MIATRRLILLASTRQLGVLDWRRGHAHWLGEFSATEQGVHGLHALLANRAHLPALLVTDTVDEDYRLEILPHVQGAARDALLTRKLKQLFRNTRYTGAWLQGREQTGRRDDRYLLAALTDPDWLTPWLSALQRARLPLVGIVPIALAGQSLLARLAIKDTHVLLAHRLSSGLRLSYYQEGLLRFSRLIGGEAPSQFSGNAADEIAKTQLYLTGQRLLPREARLHVLLLDASHQLDAALAPLNADPAFQARSLDMEQLARALRIPAEFLTATPEIAPLVALASDAPSLNLAPPDLLQGYREHRWKRGIYAAASGVAALGLVATGATWLHAQSLTDETHQLVLTQQQLDARYQTLARQFPALGVRPDQLAPMTALAQQLDQQRPDPHALLRTLGLALAAAPGIQLETLSWRDPRLDAATTTPLIATLDAALADFDGNYRAALQRIDSLIQRLAAAPEIAAVNLTQSPVNADSTATLAGKASPLARNETARFTLEIQFRGKTL
ncbi:MAG: monoheme cytochrome SoxX [Thiobacillus sp.]